MRAHQPHVMSGVRLKRNPCWLCVIVTQPYVHTGKYSEGEFAISPNIVQLAVERKLPLGGDWDTTILGEDQGERCSVLSFLYTFKELCAV